MWRARYAARPARRPVGARLAGVIGAPVLSLQLSASGRLRLTLSRCLGALFVALFSTVSLAESVAGPAGLAAAADCQTTAAVNWSFTYTVNPTREFGRVTNLNGTTIGSYDLPSTLTGGSFNGTWLQPITLLQPPNTIIGSYGGAGDTALTPANTVEFFVLYNCTTRQVLHTCTGRLGTCPTTAAQGLARISAAIPTVSPLALLMLLLLVLFSGTFLLRHRLAARMRGR